MSIENKMNKMPTVKSLLSNEQFSKIRTKSDVWGICLVIHAWGLIFSSVALVIYYPNPLSYIFAIVVIGSRQLGLLILMHDSAHGTLFRSPKLNYWVGQLVCAFPLFADSEVYRNYHIRHHLNTQQPEDPDINLTSSYPISRNSLIRKFVRDLTGKTAFNQRKQQIIFACGNRKMEWGERIAQFWQLFGRQLVCNSLMLAAAVFFGHGWLYLLLWIVPLLTWHQLVLRIRNIAEHAVVGPAEDPFRNTRTTIAGVLERIFIAPYWVNYHLEHHLVMWTPCYRLPHLHQYLIKNGFKDKMEIEYGYLNLLRKVVADGGDHGDYRNKTRSVGTFSDGFKTE